MEWRRANADMGFSRKKQPDEHFIVLKCRQMLLLTHALHAQHQHQ